MTRRTSSAGSRLGAALALTGLLASSTPAAAGEPSAPGADALGLIGRTVAEVQVEAPADAFRGDAERRYALDLLGVAPGRRLAQATLRRGIENLYRTGKWRAITVLGVPVGGDRVAVRLVLEPVERIGQIRFEGPRVVTRADLERVIRLAQGGVFRPESVARATHAIQDHLDALGYPDSVVIATSRPFGEPYEREVTFSLSPNEPCRIEAVRIEGTPGLPEGVLREAARLEPGDRCDRLALDAAAERIARRYRRGGYLEAVVSGARFDYGPERRSAAAVFTVQAGTPVTFDFQGNQAVSARRLRRALDVGDQIDLSSEGLSRLADRLVAFYRERGYAFAAVSARLEPADAASAAGARRVVFRVVEGRTVRIEGVEFRGNAAVPDARLREQMLTRPRAGLGLVAAGTFQQAELGEDLDAIRGFYRRQGYLDIRIADVDFRFNRGLDRMWITITIDEGPRYVVAAFDIAGGEAIPADELRRGLPVAPGRPFSLTAVDEAVEQVVERYATRGHLFARVLPEVSVEARPPAARVRLVVTEGPRVEVGQVVYRGNFFTRTRVLTREMAVRTGDPYNPAAVLESQRNIGRLGLFRNVSVRPAEEAAGRQPEEPLPGEAPAAAGPVRRDLLVSVEEANRVDLGFGFDYSLEERLRVFGEVTHRGLFGTDRSVTLRGVAGDRESQYALEYRQPYLFDVRLDGRVALAYQDREEENFSFRRSSVVTGVQRGIRRSLKASVAYEFESTDVFDVAPGTVINPRDIGTIRIAALLPGVVWDRRDDPFNPTRGFINTLGVEVANQAFGSEVEFVRFLAGSAWFFPLERTRRVVLGVSVRAGYALAYGTSAEVPLIRRFFLGGATTVRGFERDQISPRGADGAPTGGTVSLNENLELRFPLPLGFSGAVFLDAGGVWLDEADVDPLDQRAAYGVGLRYITPVGPVRLDYGRKVDREPGEAADRFHFSIGYVF